MTGVDVGLVPARTGLAYRTVASFIEDRILRGDWAVGARLPSETALAEQLGVNRSTMREAIRVLEQNGLVRRHEGGKRLFVSAPRDADIASRVAAAMVLREMSFFELWEAMLSLEPGLAEGAAGRISADELDAIADNVARTRRALTDERSLTELDIEFHDLVAKASRNRALQLCREPISRLFYPAFLQVFSRLNAGERLIFAHERILAALRAGAASEARAWMDKHIVDFRRGYELASLDIEAPVRMPQA
ncbi:FadR/GntR family transcriptional regulator [Chelatococcus reniformis]|uniref:GntR family transcriptional regulator n=1 Tax=Chelatococcus reniformis TaxID=1494448 RepID=A0A916UTE6_9HYPH|nr:FCD domain-containing protein [Chelatococcus reniformis]GGC86737.1 GntR family transcriptional regulator [Chelatococcus reniformis]